MGKSIWRGRDDEEVSVETVALQYYEDMGYKGFVRFLVLSPLNIFIIRPKISL
jgi:hypothetical protein